MLPQPLLRRSLKALFEFIWIGILEKKVIGKAKKEIEVLFWSFKISSLTSFELGSILEKVSLSECSSAVSRASVPPAGQ